MLEKVVVLEFAIETSVLRELKFNFQIEINDI